MSATSTGEHEPTRDELDAMAYVDGELGADARAAFEQRVLREPALAREVADLRRLEIAARLATPHDPLDAEFRRLRVDRVQAALRWTALACFAAASAAVLGGFVITALACALGGGVAVAAAVLRARLRTRAVDPYVHVER